MVLQQRAGRLATATKSAAKTQANEMLVSYAASNREKSGCKRLPKRARTARKWLPGKLCDALLLLPLRRAGQVKMWTMQGALVL